MDLDEVWVAILVALEAAALVAVTRDAMVTVYCAEKGVGLFLEN